MGRCDSDRTTSCRHLAIPFLLATLSLAATLARAQDNYEIEVYGGDLVDPGRTMVELHSSFTIDGSKTVAEHETVEITHGFIQSWERICR